MECVNGWLAQFSSLPPRQPSTWTLTLAYNIVKAHCVTAYIHDPRLTTDDITNCVAVAVANDNASGGSAFIINNRRLFATWDQRYQPAMVPEAGTALAWTEKGGGQSQNTVSWLAQEVNKSGDHCVSSSAESDSECHDELSHRSILRPATVIEQPSLPLPPPLPLTSATLVEQRASVTPAAVSTSDRPHVCPHPGCDKAYYKLGKLNRHLATHSDTRLHTCPHTGCIRAFHRADHLHRHLLSHFNDRRYTCQQAGCGRAFLTSTHLRRHMKTHDCAYHCTVDGCGQSFNKHARLTLHIAEQHSEQSAGVGLACTYPPCAQSFSSRALLNKHIHLCHLPHRYTCVDCLASFARHVEWRRHRRQHDQDLVPCPTCQLHVTRKRLTQHLHTHTAHASSTAASHVCDVPGCERQFVSASGLKAHQRAVHREEDEGFECDECGREFGYRSVLDRHVRKLHGQGSEERKRKVSEKDKAFGRLSKRTKRQEEQQQGDVELVNEQTKDSDGGSEQADGGERESERIAISLESVQGTAICVM